MKKGTPYTDCFSPKFLTQSMRVWNDFFKGQMDAARYFSEGVLKYNNDFLSPLLQSASIFSNVESSRLLKRDPLENIISYEKLLEFNVDLISSYYLGTMKVLDEYNKRELTNFLTAWHNTLFNIEGNKLDDFINRQCEMLKTVTREYPQAIREIEPEYGFHFERGENIKFAETERFILYRITPTDDHVETDDSCKPIIIIPPFVLGSNVLAFLPGERKSYTHSFANKGIPTYIRILKDIQLTPEVQTMSAEDDALDTRYFCEKVKEKHGTKVTLNGYCQGGFSVVCNILSGKLDGLVDAIITCVAPMDGTRSKGLGQLLKNLPQIFNDLSYGTKTLPNGNQVADGELMGWVYKLKSIENAGPMVSFLRDMFMVSGTGEKPVQISKTVAGINYWLQNERSDIPLAITKMSFDSYRIPITKDGTLPVTMFGKKLNFKAIRDKNIQWLLCYGEKDDLVEKEVALAPLDFLDVEVTPFPKGHVAIATSWSNPGTECALDKVFCENKNYRGPVKFQLDLNEALKTATGTK